MRPLQILVYAGVAAAGSTAVTLLDSLIARSTPLGKDYDGRPFTTYEHGVAMRALQMSYNVTGNSSYLSYHQAGVSNLISSNGTIIDYDLGEYSVDDLRLGPEFLYTYLLTNSSRAAAAATQLRRQLDTQPQNSQGGYWHRTRYRNQMWLDGQYMALPFYAQWTQIFDPRNRTAWDDILRQFRLVRTNTFDERTGLLRHGYDDSHRAVWADQETGKSPEVWIRAVGWWSMALVDVVEYFPKSHEGWNTIAGWFREIMAAVVRAVDEESGGWWLVMSQPGREGNYIESSGTAMFTYSLLKGVRTGLLQDTDQIQRTIGRAWELITKRWVRPIANGNGTVDWEGTVRVGSLDGSGTFDYYIDVPLRQNDLKGIAAAVFAGVEYEYLRGRVA